MSLVEAWETAVLAAVGRPRPSEADLERWARGYERLSERLTSARVELRGGSASSDDPDQAVSAALVHGTRTLRWAEQTFRRRPPQGRSVLELGAGWGPVGFAASAAGAGAVTLVERSSHRLRLAGAAFAAAGLPAPELRCEDAARPIGRFDEVWAPYVLNEMAEGGEREASELVRGWLRVLSTGPEARLTLVEPGTPMAAQRLQVLRDALRADWAVLAPCPTAASPCPLLDRPDDWCHFTLRWELGPVGARIAALARRRHHEQHLSWLTLGHASVESVGPPDDVGGGVLRVHTVFRSEKAKRRVLGCTGAKRESLVALRRNRPSYDRLDTLCSGDLVALPAGLSVAGDGLRLSPGEFLPRLESPGQD